MKRIELFFENEEGKTVKFSLDEPIDPVDTVTVNAAMDEIVTQKLTLDTQNKHLLIQP